MGRWGKIGRERGIYLVKDANPETRWEKRYITLRMFEKNHGKSYYLMFT